MILTSISISVVAVLLSLWLGRRDPVRSSGLTAGMLVLLVVSPVLFLLPKVEVSWMRSGLFDGADKVVKDAAALGGSEPFLYQGGGLWLSGLTVLWLVGSGLMLLRLYFQCRVVRRWCQAAEPITDAEHRAIVESSAAQLSLKELPAICFTSELHSPVITGIFRPVLLLPQVAKGWSEETLRMVVLHELGHFQRKDLWVNMTAHVACVVHWFNPLVWMLRRRLIDECEYACDAHVVAQGVDAKSYVNALCDVAESCRYVFESRGRKATPATVLAMANQASLKNRVVNVLRGQPQSSRWMVVMILGLSASVTLAYTVLRPQTMELIETFELNETEAAVVPTGEYSAEEVELRHSANPFPSDK